MLSLKICMDKLSGITGYRDYHEKNKYLQKIDMGEERDYLFANPIVKNPKAMAVVGDLGKVAESPNDLNIALVHNFQNELDCFVEEMSKLLADRTTAGKTTRVFPILDRGFKKLLDQRLQLEIA